MLNRWRALCEAKWFKYWVTIPVYTLATVLFVAFRTPSVHNLEIYKWFNNWVVVALWLVLLFDSLNLLVARDKYFIAKWFDLGVPVGALALALLLHPLNTPYDGQWFKGWINISLGLWVPSWLIMFYLFRLFNYVSR